MTDKYRLAQDFLRPMESEDDLGAQLYSKLKGD
jgi:hypothetical protein